MNYYKGEQEVEEVRIVEREEWIIESRGQDVKGIKEGRLRSFIERTQEVCMKKLKREWGEDTDVN